MAFQPSGGDAKSIQGFPVDTTDPSNGQQLVYNSSTGKYEPSTPAGTGDVVGPVSAVDGVIAVFDGVSGKAIKQGSGALPVKATGAEIDAGIDDAKFATAKAIADSDLVMNADLGSAAYEETTAFATAAQGSTADTALQPTSSIGDLSDVDITGIAVDQTLKWNGASLVPGTFPVSAGGAGQDFFHDATPVIASSAENLFAVETLTTIPSGAVETVESVNLTNNTLPVDAYLDGVLGRTSIPAGTWEFDLYASVNSITGGRISTVTRNIFQVIPQAVNTVTVTGTGTSRTATASAGTIFAAGDANANQLLSSWLQTPKGLYQITAFASATEVTIATPSGYTNETTVAFSKWKYLFGATSDPITSTGTTYSRNLKQSFQSAFTVAVTDKLGCIAFATSNNTTTVNFVYQGTAHYSHITAPTVTLHNSLPGLQGGTSNEFYHLTSAQATVVGNTSGMNTGDEVDMVGDTGTGGVAGLAPAPAAGDAAAGKYLKANGTWATPPAGGATAFTSLTDVPAAYTGQGGKVVAVKADVSGLEFVTPSAGGGLTWNEVTGTTQVASVDNGYITNNAALVTVTLPSTCAVGKVIRIAGKGAGGWKVAQNAGQSIDFLSASSTNGTGGYVSSTNKNDAVELLCVTADTLFKVVGSVGNITVA